LFFSDGLSTGMKGSDGRRRIEAAAKAREPYLRQFNDILCTSIAAPTRSGCLSKTRINGALKMLGNGDRSIIAKWR